MIIGIVGKANVGKSTFFKASTLMDVEIANYPFATIKPNSGVGFVRVKCVDREFGVQCNPREGYCKKGIRFVPVQLIDVAGLVPGAHEGKGMGNQFLDDLNQADCLIHIIDASGSTNEKGEPVDPGSYDPAKDIEFLEVELDMWYLRILKKGWEKFARQIKQEKGEIYRAVAKQMSGLRVSEDIAKSAIKNLSLPDDFCDWQDNELLKIAQELRKLTKPMLIAANKIDVDQGKKNLERLKTRFPGRMIIACSAESELALKEAAKHNLIDYVPGDNKFKVKGKLNEKQKKALEFINNNVLSSGSTGVQEIIDSAVLKLLKYKAVFPGGVGKLQDQDGNYIPDCFFLPEKATALDFAFRLHTDFGKNFIKAVDVRTKKPIAKDHVLEHRQIVQIFSSK